MNYWYIPSDPNVKPYWSEGAPTGNDRNDPGLRVFRKIEGELFEVTSGRKFEMIDPSRLVKDPQGGKFTKREDEAKDLVDNQGWTYI